MGSLSPFEKNMFSFLYGPVDNNRDVCNMRSETFGVGRVFLYYTLRIERFTGKIFLEDEILFGKYR